MRIDAHTHIWRRMTEYPQPAATLVSPLYPVPVELLDQYLDEYGVERAVLVQPVYPGDDNSYVADCAAARPQRYAAVCVVDVSRADAAERLEYWVTERHCRGVRLRPRVPHEAPWLGDRRTLPLWQCAERSGVVVSLLADFQHLPTVASLAEQFPRVPIVIDHMAHPTLPLDAQPAGKPLLQLAQYSNVYIKLSGYNYFSQHAYPYRDCLELLRQLIAGFGPRRLLWGSDFPHVLLACGYQRALLLLPRLQTELAISSQDLDWMLGDTARRLYWPELK